MIVSDYSVTLAEIQVPMLAASVGAALTVIVQHCGVRFKWFGTPHAHHTHKKPVPRLGGVAVYIAIAVAFFLCDTIMGYRAVASALPILLAALPVLLVGSYDDLRHVSPKVKILVQLLAAAVLLAASWRLTGTQTLTPLVILPVWLVITVNSFNLIDGADGLASGTGIIIGVALAILNFALGNVALAALSIITSAACMGFLPFNLLRRRIFLGDSGSLTIGFILAAIAYQTPHDSHLPWAAMVLFGYPLTETSLSILRRGLKGRSLLRPDREHLHHKLRHARFSSAQTASILCLLALGFASLGLMLGLGLSRWYGVGGAVILFVSVARSFGYVRWRTVALLRHRLVSRHQPREQGLPDIAGYLPFK